MDFSISDNLIIKDYFNEPFAHKNILNYKNIKKHARKMVKKYHVKTPSEDVRVRNLSGGNQQKVVIARELDPEPVLDLVAHPTRGLDLGRRGQRPGHPVKGAEPRRGRSLHLR